MSLQQRDMAKLQMVGRFIKIRNIDDLLLLNVPNPVSNILMWEVHTSTAADSSRHERVWLQYSTDYVMHIPTMLQVIESSTQKHHPYKRLSFHIPLRFKCTKEEGAMIRHFFANLRCDDEVRISSGGFQVIAEHDGDGLDYNMSYLLEGLSMMRHLPKSLTMWCCREDMLAIRPEKCWRNVVDKDSLRDKIKMETNVLDGIETASDLGMRNWSVDCFLTEAGDHLQFCRWLRRSAIQRLTVRDNDGSWIHDDRACDMLRQEFMVHPTLVGFELIAERASTRWWLKLISFKQIRHATINACSLNNDGLLEFPVLIPELKQLQSIDVKVNRLSKRGFELLQQGLLKSLSLVNIKAAHWSSPKWQSVERLMALQEIGDKIAQRNQNLNRVHELMRSRVAPGLWALVLNRVGSSEALVDPLYIGLREHGGFLYN